MKQLRASLANDYLVLNGLFGDSAVVYCGDLLQEVMPRDDIYAYIENKGWYYDEYGYIDDSDVDPSLLAPLRETQGFYPPTRKEALSQLHKDLKYPIYEDVEEDIEED